MIPPHPSNPAPDGVEPPPIDARQPLLHRLLLLPLQLMAIALAAWISSQVPLPVLDAWLPVKNVVVAGTAIVLSGKCLYDTLFFDRFWP